MIYSNTKVYEEDYELIYQNVFGLIEECPPESSLFFELLEYNDLSAIVYDYNHSEKVDDAIVSYISINMWANNDFDVALLTKSNVEYTYIKSRVENCIRDLIDGTRSQDETELIITKEEIKLKNIHNKGISFFRRLNANKYWSHGAPDRCIVFNGNHYSNVNNETFRLISSYIQAHWGKIIVCTREPNLVSKLNLDDNAIITL